MLMLKVIIFCFFALLIGCVDKNTGGGVLFGGLIWYLIWRASGGNYEV